ncbi:MAG TPA: SRPBCC family protein [Sphingomicrobium sp.]|jgi:uncharacterized membrane protein|nr:SRPBCC family protein [Sphingomicrobium sp.]
MPHEIHDQPQPHHEDVEKEVVRRNRRAAKQASNGNGANRALLGLGLAAATAGAAAFFFTRSREDEIGSGPLLSDAPDHVLRGKALQRARNTEDGRALVGRTVTVNRPKQELYERWRDFTRFPEFMDNVREIVRLDDRRSKWTIEAPMGATVELVTRIVEDQPGETIAWVSEPESQIQTEGRVEFADAPPGRGTYVRLLLRYTPPAGTVGRMVAKVLQREPNVQARRDLRRFKQLLETGEVPVNASPSARKSESPTEARV